eukprot:365988-Chlamydomonas_euryale.AAC.12
MLLDLPVLAALNTLAYSSLARSLLFSTLIHTVTLILTCHTNPQCHKLHRLLPHSMNTTLSTLTSDPPTCLCPTRRCEAATWAAWRGSRRRGGMHALAVLVSAAWGAAHSADIRGRQRERGTGKKRLWGPRAGGAHSCADWQGVTWMHGQHVPWQLVTSSVGSRCVQA